MKKLNRFKNGFPIQESEDSEYIFLAFVDQIREAAIRIGESKKIKLEKVFEAIMFHYPENLTNQLQFVIKDFVDDLKDENYVYGNDEELVKEIKKYIEESKYDIENNISPFDIFLKEYANNIQQWIRYNTSEYIANEDEPEYIKNWHIAEYLNKYMTVDGFHYKQAQRALVYISQLHITSKELDSIIIHLYYLRLQTMFTAHIINSFGIAITTMGHSEITENKLLTQYNNFIVSAVLEEDEDICNKKILDIMVQHINNNGVHISDIESKHIDQITPETYYKPIVEVDGDIFVMFNDGRLPSVISMVGDNFEYMSLMSNHFSGKHDYVFADMTYDMFKIHNNNIKLIDNFIIQKQINMSYPLLQHTNDMTAFGDGSPDAKKNFLNIAKWEEWVDELYNVLSDELLEEEHPGHTFNLLDI